MAELSGTNISSSHQLCPEIQSSYPNSVQDCYASRSTTGYSIYIVPSNTSCDSFLLLPAEQLWSPAVRSVWYLVGMLYCFVGLAAIVRVFMEALDRISSTYAMVTRRDSETGREQQRLEKVWNGTVVNIALMALGTSAPEIVIALVDALKHLNKPPGVLGPGTVLGSAAFNLMVISAVCVVTPGAHSIKRIQAFGVFLLELAASTWAYVWVLLVLKVFSPGRITITEACITLLFFPLFILLAYAQDRRWLFSQPLPLPLPFLPHVSAAHPRRGSLTRYKSHGSRQALIAPSASAAAAGDGAWWRDLWWGGGGRTRGESPAEGKGGGGEGVSDSGGLGEKGVQAEVEMQGANGAVGEEVGGGVKTGRSSAGGAAAAGAAAAADAIGAREEGFAGDGSGRSHGSSSTDDVEDGEVGQMEFSQQQQQQQQKGGPEIITVESTATEEGTPAPGSRSISLNMQPPSQPQRSSSHLRRRVSAGGPASAASGFMEQASDNQSLSHCLGQHLWLRSQLTSTAYAPASAVLLAPAPAGPIPAQQQQQQQQEEVVQDGAREGGGAVRGEEMGLGPEVAAAVGAAPEDLPQEKEPSSYSPPKHQGLGEVWLQQIERAMSVQLSGNQKRVSLLDLGVHFVSFYWKLLFSLIPPPSLMRGWPAFILCLCFMAGISFLIEEFARLFACTSGFHLFSVAIVFVASGTSVPDLLASRTAAKLSPSADVAIANITGSNAVNVFVGLGLAWLTKAIYDKAAYGGSVFVPHVSNLEASAVGVLCTTLIFTGIMGLRRGLVGGELGGSRRWAWSAFTVYIVSWCWFLIATAIVVNR